MSGATSWEVWAILAPLVGAPATLVARPRHRAGIALAAGGLAVAAVAALAIRVLRQGPVEHAIGAWGAPLGIELRADGLAVTMLVMTALVCACVGIYATGYLRAGAGALFWPAWLLLWAALDALFLSRDLFNLYVTLELGSLAAVALTALGEPAAAVRAGMRYLVVAVVASLAYLLGVALLYGARGSLALDDLRGAALTAPLASIALGLVVPGLLLKSALAPLHGWLPPAHSSAPAPASALLSGLVVEAPFYVLLRLWLELPAGARGRSLGTAVGVLGSIAVVWGAVQALRASRLKRIVAYSTVSQLGYLFLWIPLTDGTDRSRAAWMGAGLFALVHACAKAALFLAIGTVTRALGAADLDSLAGAGRRMPVASATIVLASVSLLGLPPSGGFVAKWLLLVAIFEAGQPGWALVVGVGSLLSAGYLFRLLERLMTSTLAAPPPRPARRLEGPALGLALVALLLGAFVAEPLALLRIGAPAPVARGAR